jgi:ABC-2 type transport system permease protein
VQLDSRNVGGQQVQEIQVLPYPYFVDVRSDGMGDTPMLDDLTAITLNWASPVSVDESRLTEAQVTTLFESSPESWQTSNTDLSAFLQTYLATSNYFIEGPQARTPLGVIVGGSFSSFFSDKPSPFDDPSTAPPPDPNAAPTPEPALSFTEQSAPTARLIVVGSSEFLNDNILGASADVSGDRYLNTLLFIQNLVDWSTEDTALLSIRARGNSTRLLDSLNAEEQRNWEYGNYAAALLSLILLGLLWQVLRRNEQPMPLVLPPSQTTPEQEAA